MNGATQNLSNQGKEFWVGYGHHQFFENGSNSQQLVIYLSAEQAANVTVSINGTSYAQTYTVAANTVIVTAPLPKSGSDDCRLFSGATGFTGQMSEGFSERGIHIVSDVPIVAYAHIFGSVSSGATMLMPAETWGYSYTSVNSKQAYATNCFSWMFIIAKENNTKVEIIPSGPSRGGKPAGVPFQILLNKGQIYQMLGANLSNNDGYELTGTKVKSIANNTGNCFPIAVFSGSSRTWNPASCGSGGGDNDIQQLFPSQAWGHRYLTAPTSLSSNAALNQTNTFKVLIKDPSTVVKRNGNILTGLIANTYYLFESNMADYITADKPIMVAQFMTGGACSGGGINLGDPEMIYISPIEQGIKRIGFYRNNQQAIAINYLTLIIPTEGLHSLTIDGSPYYNYAYNHPYLSGYTVVIKSWTAAQAQCIVQSDSAFTAITYGLGSVESYGYNAGTQINDLTVIGNIHNTLDTTTSSHQFTCRNTPTELSVLTSYQPTSMIWNLQQLSTIIPNKDITVVNPVPVDSILQNGIRFYKYNLPGVYQFSDTGTFLLPVKNTHASIDNCNNSEIVRFSVKVNASPVANFSTLHSGCISDTVHFFSSDTTGQYHISTWSWTFPDATSSSSPTPTKNFISPGSKMIKLKVISTEGCVGDTMEAINIFERPTTSLGPIPTYVCEGSSIQLTAADAFGGKSPIKSWYWDFGNQNSTSAINNNPLSVIYPEYGTYMMKHVVKVSDACISDTVSNLITVFAKPSLKFSFNAGCLPTNGGVQFNNSSKVADGQSLKYQWSFGDMNATATNPNTSTLQNPFHQFAVGTYNIQYEAITNMGCVTDSNLAVSFSVRPLLTYPKLPSVCASAKGTISIANGLVTNGVPGNGFYKGPYTDLAGEFNPSAAGPGLYTIWYVFTSWGGCQDSASSSIKVLPKPTGNFQVNTDFCQDQFALISDKSSLSAGKIVSWNWNFDDGTTRNDQDNGPFKKSYDHFGNYRIQLTAISDSSCESDAISHMVQVHAQPKVDIKLPIAVCMPGGLASFINMTSSPDQATINYQWNFGDMSNVSIDQQPTHVYMSPGSFKIYLKATTSFGCVSDTLKVLNAFYDKPVSKFIVAIDTLCQHTEYDFPNMSTSVNNSVNSWNWNFGDGTVSSLSHPVKKYAQPGRYIISLKVKNTVGCTSDPFQDTVLVYPQPVIKAGPSYIVPEGTLITLNPSAKDFTELRFSWSPAVDFPNASVFRPSILASHNQTYKLSATGKGNCSAFDTLTVKILRPVNPTNSFSPNGDGINDTWQIPNLAAYPGSLVEVFNRYGQIVYQNSGYAIPWDGRCKGATLPVATYYYIIQLKNGFAPITGSITIIK